MSLNEELKTHQIKEIEKISCDLNMDNLQNQYSNVVDE